MRGKGSSTIAFAFRLGITPAYAGKSCEWAEFATTEEDHPRLCGEKCIFSFLYSSVIGSPPPMRGKDLFHDKFLHVFRITPAYAGKRMYRQ